MAIPDKKSPVVKPRIFISYSRKDGELFAKDLRIKLEAVKIPLWQDRVGEEGGKDWWLQILDALDKVEFMVLVMTPEAMESPIIRKEWRYARQKGVCVYPVKGVPDDKLDYAALPRWMHSAHFYDLGYEEDNFINDLNTRCQELRVPFMVEDLPKNFVQRPEEFNALIDQLLDVEREEPLAITTNLLGAGGYGKTTLAMALCHDERVQEAYDDGILWVTLGEELGDLTEKIKNIIEILSGERPGFTDENTASAHLSELLADRDILIVIDDAWNRSHIKPFLRGGPRCSRLITTRNSDTLPTGSKQNILDAMQADEAQSLLSYRLPATKTEKDAFQNLAHRLGLWPLVLKLANAFLVERVINRGQALSDAIAYMIKRLEKYGIIALDAPDTKERDQAVEATLSVSLELLSEEEKERIDELAVFPEDINIPLETVERLWSHTGFDELDTEDLCERLFRLSLLQRFDPNNRVIRLHDVIRGYLRGKNKKKLNQMQTGFLKSYGADQWPDMPPSEPYLWQYLPFHLVDCDQTKTLYNLLCDFAWIRRKIELFDLNSLLGDYDYLPDDQELKLIQSSLRLSANQITTDLNQLTPHLLGRLMDQASPGIQRLLDHAITAQKGSWFRPTTTSLPAAGGPLLRTLEGHSNAVYSVAFSLDGKTIVSGSRDYTLKLWDVSKCKVIRTFEGHSAEVNAVAFSPDGKTIVSGSDDDTLRLWDVSSIQLIQVFEGYREGIIAAAFSPDGKTIASGSWSKTFDLWDVSTGRVIRTFEGHSSSVAAVAFSPDGKTIVSGSLDNTLKLWDISTSKVIWTFEGHSNNVTAVAFSPDGKTIVSGSDDSTLKLWDISTGQVIRTFEGHSEEVISVAFSPDGKTIVSGSWDNTLTLWDVRKGRAIQTFEEHSNPVATVAFSPDGKTIVSGSGDSTLKLWDVSMCQAIPVFERHSKSVTTVAFSPDGKTVVSGSEDNTLKLWDISTCKVIRTFKGHSDDVTTVAFSPDGKTVVSGSEDCTLKLWDVQTCQVIRTFEAHSGEVNAVAFSPDGKTIVSGSDDDTPTAWDNTLKLWDVSTCQEIRTFEAHSGEVTAVAFSPDGKTVVSVSRGATFSLWDLSSTQEIRIFEGHSEDVTAVAFSPDGKTIVSGSWDSTLKLWDVQACQEIRTFEGHSKDVIAVAFSPDGKTVVSGSEDCTLKLWDIDTGQEMASFIGESEIECVSFSPCGKIVLAGDTGGRLHFFRIECSE